MRHLLSADGLRTLGNFAVAGTLVALDYDGTLVPIQMDRDAARLAAGMRMHLQRLATRYPTVVITGRSREDISRLLEGVAGLELIGSHGLEQGTDPPEPFRRRAAAWRAVLDAELAHKPGVEIEDKRYSLSVHYRGSQDWNAAREAVVCATRRLEGVRLVGGKAVLNLLPEGAPHKGDALLAACRRVGAKRAIYFGDDETDEDVFGTQAPIPLLGVRIGAAWTSAARFYLRGTLELEETLDWLVNAVPLRVAGPPVG